MLVYQASFRKETSESVGCFLRVESRVNVSTDLDSYLAANSGPKWKPKPKQWRPELK